MYMLETKLKTDQIEKLNKREKKDGRREKRCADSRPCAAGKCCEIRFQDGNCHTRKICYIFFTSIHIMFCVSPFDHLKSMIKPPNLFFQLSPILHSQ